MAGRGSHSSRAQREAAERTRLHIARKEWHDRSIARRFRDNLAVGIGGGIIVIAAIASQSVYAAVTAPTPTPSPSPSATPFQNPFQDDLPAAEENSTPTPQDTTTPSPSPSPTVK